MGRGVWFVGREVAAGAGLKIIIRVQEKQTEI